MELKVYTRSVTNGTYFENLGYYVDKIGTIYFHSSAFNEFLDWFNKSMYPKGWTLSCISSTNPCSPEYDSKNIEYDKTVSIKHNTDNISIKSHIIGQAKIETVSI